MNFLSAGAPRRSALRRPAGRAAGLVALAGLVYAAAGIAARLAAEARRYRRSADILYRRWTSIPAIAGPGMLRIHSRVRDVMTNRDPIVLVHGHGGSSYFVPLAARLSHHAPVFAPDLPGHGPSDRDARPLDVPELARALGEWMEVMGLRGATVVGHSLGCEVALHLAATRPQFVSRVVLIGPTKDARARLASAAGALQPIVVPEWGHAVHYEDPDTVAALILGLADRPERERRATPRD